MPKKNTQSLYKRLIASHLRIAALATLFLVICFILIVKIQQSTAVITEVRLPTAIASAQAVSAIDNSISQVRATVLSGANSTPQIDTQFSRQASSQIAELAKLGALSDEAYLLLEKKLRSLEESQWWVQELAGTIGNFPARQLYEQDVLATYQRIDSALNGLANNEFSNSRDVRLLASLAHQQLGEVLRGLSECVRSGSVAAIQDFRDSSSRLQPSLDELSEKVTQDSDESRLLEWLLREYKIYIAYADKTIELRKSDNWNRAQQMLTTQTEPLASDIQSQLLDLQQTQYKTLMNSVMDTEGFAQISGLLNLSLAIGLAVFAYYLAQSSAHWAANPLETLALASDEMAGNPQSTVAIPTEGPAEVLHLATRFSLMNKRLAQSTKELVVANAELQEYTHIITHDLKAPLINIRGHTTSLREQFDGLVKHADDIDVTDGTLRSYVKEQMSEQTPEAFGFIEISIAKTTLLMNAILDNSRILFRTLEVEDLNTHAAVDRVLSLFSYKLKNIEVHNDLDTRLSTDSFFLEHIMINLIDNAIKYLDPARQGVIRIRSVQNDDFLDIHVEDNGVGINSANLDIFKLFQQTNSKNEGSGVGLALTATMVEKLGGSIDYRPNDPNGTVFIVRLPR